MNNLNSFSAHNSINRITGLIDKIHATCDALLSALELNADAVSSYGYSIGTKIVLNSEYVDKVVFTMKEMKNHLNDIKDAVSTQTIDSLGSLDGVVASLLDTVDTLDTVMRENNYFHNTFGRAIEEIKVMIHHVVELLPVHA